MHSSSHVLETKILYKFHSRVNHRNEIFFSDVTIIFAKRINFVLCIIYNGNCTALAILTSNIFFTRLSNCLIMTWPRDFFGDLWIMMYTFIVNIKSFLQMMI